MIKVKYYPVRFGRECKETEIEFSRDLCIKDFIEQAGVEYKDLDVIVDGKVAERLDVPVDNQSEIIVTPKIEFAAIAAWWAAATFWQGVALVAGVLMTAYSIYQAVAAARTPKFGSMGIGMDDESPTYGWDGIKTTQEVGVPIKIVGGRHRTGGNIINQYISTDGDKQYLNLLIGICEGPVVDIKDILVNDNPIENFSGIEVTKRYGTNDQAVIPGFEDLHNLYNINAQLLKDDAYVYTTVDSDVEGFEIYLTLPNGLYQVTDNGSINSWDVGYRVEYKLHGAGSYTDLGVTTISAKSRSTVRRIFRKDGLAAGQYDIRITRTTDDSSLDPQKTGDLYLTSIDEIKTDNLIYPNTALVGIKALATDQLSGSTPNFTFVVEDGRLTFPAVLTEEGGDPVAWEDYYYDPADSLFKLLADSSILYWDGVTYTTGFCANPIWFNKDVLLNSRYGLGDFIDTNHIDEDELLEEALYSEQRVADGEGGYEKRFRMDVVLDTKTKAPDLLAQLTAVFRAFPFYSQNGFSFRIDRPGIAVQTFGMGNIVKDSFQQAWKSVNEFYNVIEVQFADQEMGYQDETISVEDGASLAAGDPRRVKTVRVFTTKKSYAIREGRYALWLSKYINRSVNMKVGMDGLASQVGNIVNVAHDVPQWGYSGRTQAGSTTTLVKLDREVIIEAGKTYHLLVRQQDGTQEEVVVSDGPATYPYTELNVAALSQAPAEGCPYSFGEVNKVFKPFHLMNIKRENSGDAGLALVEYNESIYDDTAPVIPTNNYSSLSLSTDIPVIEDLMLTEGTALTPDGAVKLLIDVWFNKPNNNLYYKKYQKGKVYISDNGGLAYRYVGETSGTHFQIDSDLTKQEYYVKVVTVCNDGFEDSIDNAPSENITVTGKLAAPGNVSGFAFTWVDVLDLFWNPNVETDLVGYEVRDEDGNWGTDDAHLIYRGYATKKTLVPSGRTVGTYYIKAFNRSGVYSDVAASIVPENDIPSVPSALSLNVAWNVATLSWTDTEDPDILYYEVWKSNTNAWAGEEEMIGKISGKAFSLEAGFSRSGQAASAGENTITDPSLIGFDNDYFKGDKIEITDGTGAGQILSITGFDGETGQITVEENWSTEPDDTSKFMIRDVCFLRVRGVDQFGPGDFSTTETVEFTAFDENAFGDKVITARKLYVACLSAISANMGMLTAGIIQGGTIQTGSSGARTVFDSTGIYAYNSSCQKTLEIKDGCICAGSIKLFDLDNECNYSYLDAGALKFHDALGDVPYVKRIASGTEDTGGTVVLTGWTTSPEVQVGIKSILSYEAAHSGQNQKWDIYASTPEWFCCSSTCYGYCFDVHAELQVADGTGSEQVFDYAFGGTLSATGTGVCKTQVRSQFQLWCNGDCTNYYYGTICYNVCYRKCGDATWCACQFSYTQPHASVGQITSTANDCQLVTFPCNDQWEILNTQASISWTDSGFPSYQCLLCCYQYPVCCCYWVTGCTCTIYGSACTMNILYACCQTAAGNCQALCTAVVTFSGFPANVYASVVYWCYAAAPTVQGHNYSDPAVWYVNNGGCYPICFCDGAQSVSITLVPGSCDCVCSGGTGRYCKTSGTCQATWTMYAYVRSGCWCHHTCICANAYCICQVLTYCVQCCCTVCLWCCYWYCTGAAAACCYEHLYSLCDTYGCYCVLDPNGVLNWLAIAYS